tara:strand:+ start:1217 stop:1456 length:240 start_codon:yes stop_codon:yes gene_type:complete
MIPKYVKCVEGGWLGLYFVGKFYKTSIKYGKTTFLQILKEYPNDFVEVTEEEYNIQEGITTTIDNYDTLLEIMNKLDIR